MRVAPMKKLHNCRRIAAEWKHEIRREEKTQKWQDSAFIEWERRTEDEQTYGTLTTFWRRWLSHANLTQYVVDVLWTIHAVFINCLYSMPFIFTQWIAICIGPVPSVVRFSSLFKWIRVCFIPPHTVTLSDNDITTPCSVETTHNASGALHHSNCSVRLEPRSSDIWSPHQISDELVRYRYLIR